VFVANVVEVAFVVVAFRAVKFWSVVEPVRRRLPIIPEVVLKFVTKRFVDVALVVVPFVMTKFVAVPVVTARFVVVACEVVAFTPVKFWRVVDPVARSVFVCAVVEKRFVAVSAVEDAYGRTDAVVPVAMKVLAVTFPAKIAEDEANT
jgi:hypothetical protein